MKIDNTLQNSKCRLCGDKDEIINHIISEYRKLAQKEYNSRHTCAGKVIHWELCKRLEFDQTTKRYMHKLEFVWENDMHKILMDFEIQTDNSILTRRSYLVVINKKKRTCHLEGFAASVIVKDRQILRSCQRSDKTVEDKFGLVWFYGISTILGNLMTNLVYSYILDIYIWVIGLIRAIGLIRSIGLRSRVFSNGPGDWGSIPGQVTSKS